MVLRAVAAYLTTTRLLLTYAGVSDIDYGTAGLYASQDVDRIGTQYSASNHQAAARHDGLSSGLTGTTSESSLVAATSTPPGTGAAAVSATNDVTAAGTLGSVRPGSGLILTEGWRRLRRLHSAWYRCPAGSTANARRRQANRRSATFFHSSLFESPV